MDVSDVAALSMLIDERSVECKKASLTRIHLDCLQEIVSWLHARELCKLVWCGDARLGRLFKSCPLQLKVRLMDRLRPWIASDFFCSPNIMSLEISSEKCVIPLGQVSKLPPSLTSL